MKENKIIDLISKSEYSSIQKNVMMGFVERSLDEQERHRNTIDLIKRFSPRDYVDEVLLNTEDVIIYKVSERKSNDWTVKYPYRSIYLDDKGVWRRIHCVSPTFDIAFLYYLEAKHLGMNSQFVNFASKMLEIKIEE